MQWQDVQKLPEWLQELHGAVERMNLVVLSTPSDHYEAVKTLRDQAEAIWLHEVNTPRVVILPPDEDMGRRSRK